MLFDLLLVILPLSEDIESKWQRSHSSEHLQLATAPYIHEPAVGDPAITALSNNDTNDYNKHDNDNTYVYACHYCYLHLIFVSEFVNMLFCGTNVLNR